MFNNSMKRTLTWLLGITVIVTVLFLVMYKNNLKPYRTLYNGQGAELIIPTNCLEIEQAIASEQDGQYSSEETKQRAEAELVLATKNGQLSTEDKNALEQVIATSSSTEVAHGERLAELATAQKTCEADSVPPGEVTPDAKISPKPLSS